MTIKKQKRKDDEKTTIIIGLIVNLFLPGLGTIIFGKYDIGIIQLVLSLVGFFISITTIGVIIGIPLIIGMWIWALVTGIIVLKKNK
ncbi:MAG: hypothetical protein QW041_01770 [Candidatus Pacearchaeota archaeon]